MFLMNSEVDRYRRFCRGFGVYMLSIGLKQRSSSLLLLPLLTLGSSVGQSSRPQSHVGFPYRRSHHTTFQRPTYHSAPPFAVVTVVREGKGTDPSPDNFLTQILCSDPFLHSMNPMIQHAVRVCYQTSPVRKQMLSLIHNMKPQYTSCIEFP